MKVYDLIECNGRWMPGERDATPEEEYEWQREKEEVEREAQYAPAQIEDYEAALSQLGVEL